MQRRVPVLLGLMLLLLCAFVLPGCRSTAPPAASPSSPAVGTWRKSVLAYDLNGDGTGQELHGPKGSPRKAHPLVWTEQNGVVTITIHEPRMPEMEAVGQLSPDKRTLTITQFGGTGNLRSSTRTVNWVLKKQ